MDFRLADIFGNGMIFQRRMPIRVYGMAYRECDITVSLEQDIVTAHCKPGPFAILLPPREAGSGLSLSVYTDKQKESFHHIYCGEVWVAGGQSNMAMSLESTEEWIQGVPL